MKHLKVLLSAMVVLVASITANAQKIATIDLNAVLSLMPEKKAADEKLEVFAKGKQAELQKQGEALQKEVAAYQQSAPKLTEAQRKAKEEELVKKQQNLQAFEQAAQKDLLERQNAEYAPIEKKFQDAINKAAVKNGWEFVVDGNSSIFLYKGGTDATQAVKKELGL